LTVEEADLPDLAITGEDITYVPAVPRVGEAVSISITVSNIGTAGTEETTIVAVRLGNNRILQADLLPLGAGEDRTLDLIWPANEIQTPLTYPLTYWVDPDNKIKELDRSNNNATKEITFVNPPAAALENLLVTTSHDEVVDGDKVTVTVSLDNTGDAADLVSIEVKDGLETVASKQSITVAAGGSVTESFDIQLKGTGDHTLEVTIYRGTEVAQDPSGNDLIDSVTVTVTEEGDGGGGLGLMVIVIIVVLLAIVGVAAYFLMGRK
jgi:subtilase family serine protease